MTGGARGGGRSQAREAAGAWQSHESPSLASCLCCGLRIPRCALVIPLWAISQICRLNHFSRNLRNRLPIRRLAGLPAPRTRHPSAIHRYLLSFSKLHLFIPSCLPRASPSPGVPLRARISFRRRPSLLASLSPRPPPLSPLGPLAAWPSRRAAYLQSLASHGI